MIDDKDIHGTFLHLQFEPELLLHSSERSAAESTGWHAPPRVWHPLQCEIVDALEPSPIQRGAAQYVRQRVD
jgi:hypothetical protein